MYFDVKFILYHAKCNKIMCNYFINFYTVKSEQKSFLFNNNKN